MLFAHFFYVAYGVITSFQLAGIMAAGDTAAAWSLRMGFAITALLMLAIYHGQLHAYFTGYTRVLAWIFYCLAFLTEGVALYAKWNGMDVAGWNYSQVMVFLLAFDAIMAAVLVHGHMKTTYRRKHREAQMKARHEEEMEKIRAKRLENRRKKGQRWRESFVLRGAGFKMWVGALLLSVRGWKEAWYAGATHNLNGTRILGKGLKRLPPNDHSEPKAKPSGDGQASRPENITVTPGKA